MKLIKILAVLFTLCLIGCKVKQEEDIKPDKDKLSWILAYKANVFTSCLKHSGAIIEKDASPSLNFEVLADVRLVSRTDSLGKGFVNVIDQRSVWLNREGSEGYKAIVNGCLDYYNSAELDSLANLDYQRIQPENGF